MSPAEQFLCEGHAFLAAFRSRKLQVLPGGEVARMCGHEIEEGSFVFGVAESAKVVDAGFREGHGSQTQNGSHDLAFISNAAEARGVFGARVNLKTCPRFFSQMAGVVVTGSEFQVYASNFHVPSF